MAQHKAPFTLLKRKTSKGKVVWYYRLASDPKRVPHSTGKNTKWEATQFVEGLLSTGQMANTQVTLRLYAKDFFIQGVCNWTKRRQAQGFAISEPMSNMRRGHLTNHILPAFGDFELRSINPVQVENWLLEIDLANSTKIHMRGTFNIPQV